jgi:hypothetical protein
MIAVSNTTPLRYLIAIEQEHLLERLFWNTNSWTVIAFGATRVDPALSLNPRNIWLGTFAVNRDIMEGAAV